METLYVEGHDFKLGRSSRHIVVRRKGRIEREIPAINLKRVLVFGNSQLSSGLLAFLAGEGVEVAFLSPSGRYRCRLVPEASKNIPLRLAQYERHRDSSFRIAFYRVVVQAKLANQRALLRRYRRWHDRDDFDHILSGLAAARRKADRAPDDRVLRGLEGSAARLYFSAYARLLKDGFIFPGRNYHPPRDPGNVLLSFGYGLVYAELNGLLQAFGFDPLLGCCHTARYGRPSLATDIIEEFRAPLVDRLVLYLVNKRIIKPADFVVSADGCVRFEDGARRRFLEVYEAFVSRQRRDRRSGHRKNFRALFRDSVIALERAVLNRRDYRPYLDTT
jgi:CRISPR-associated protein Cas1